MELLTSLIRVEVIFTILVGFAAFGTVVTIAAPYFENDKLKSRIANVSLERDKLRAQQKAQFAGGEGRLRDKKQTGLFSQIVEVLNLRKVFQAEESKDLLRQAGFRNDNQMTTFLALRVISPILLCVIVFVYSSTLFADRVPPAMRFVAAAIGLIVGYYLPMIVVKNYVHKRQQSIKRAWSDALDLLLICVESGMALEPALIRVSREIGSQSVPLAEELTLTVAELSYLQDRRKALDNLSKRTGLETVRSVVTSLIQSERYGTPLGTALRVLAQENRDARMSEAERKAASLPPKLTVPMILFFLPVIFVVILAPALIMVLGVPPQPQ
jgi:tight adherence protein C